MGDSRSRRPSCYNNSLTVSAHQEEGDAINLAIQDAVASANILAEPLRAGALTTDDLKKVQKRREFPARLTQSFQIAIQHRVIGRVLASTGKTKLPWQLKLMKHWAFLRRIPARLIGIGVRPEHVRTREIVQPQRSR